jgi:hypothetical protein
MLIQPRHQFDKVAGKAARIKLMNENLVPRVPSSAGRTRQRKDGVAARGDDGVDAGVGDPDLKPADEGIDIVTHDAAVGDPVAGTGDAPGQNLPRGIDFGCPSYRRPSARRY